MRVRIIGAGRAGRSFEAALAGRAQVELLGRGSHRHAAADTDLLLLTVPDGAIAVCAATIEPGPSVIAHVSGATGLAALAPHDRRGSLHPLISMPSGDVGAARLRGAWMAVSGDSLLLELARLLDGRTFAVDEDGRALYHATAAIAANHLVALMGQVERLAGSLGIPTDAFFELARGAFDDVVERSATAALTGPVRRRDWDTVRRHLTALPADERSTYLALAAAAARIDGRTLPPELTGPT